MLFILVNDVQYRIRIVSVLINIMKLCNDVKALMNLCIVHFNLLQFYSVSTYDSMLIVFNQGLTWHSKNSQVITYIWRFKSIMALSVFNFVYLLLETKKSNQVLQNNSDAQLKACFFSCGNHCTMANKTGFGRGSRNFSKGGGVEDEKFERKMFVDTRINACTHKNRQTCTYFSLLLFKRIVYIFCFVFFTLFYF